MKNVQIITETAMCVGEDYNEFIWAGYLIDGEVRWVQNYDFKVDYYPGRKPLIVCAQSEFNVDETAAIPAPHKVGELS